MNRSRLIYLVQLILGVALLLGLLSREDLWASALAVLGGLDLSYVPFLLAFSVLFIWISSVKWRLFLHERKIEVPLLRCMKLYTIGIFFNNFVPTMVGGDVARSYLMGRHIDSQARSAASVFLERFTGLVALVFLGVSSVVIHPSLLEERLVLVSVSAVGGGTLVGMALIFWPKLWQGRFERWRETSFIGRARDLIQRLHDNVREIRENPALFRQALIYSFAFHLLAGINAYVAALAIGSKPQFLMVLTLTPLVLLVASVPLTPNSIGLFEWAFSIYLVPAGLSPEAGLAVALIVRAKNLAVSMVGGLLFLTERGLLTQSAELNP